MHLKLSSAKLSANLSGGGGGGGGDYKELRIYKYKFRAQRNSSLPLIGKIFWNMC